MVEHSEPRRRTTRSQTNSQWQPSQEKGKARDDPVLIDDGVSNVLDPSSSSLHAQPPTTTQPRSQSLALSAPSQSSPHFGPAPSPGQRRKLHQYARHVFTGLKIVVVWDDLPSDARHALAYHVQDHGGIWVEPPTDPTHVQRADIVVVPYRDIPAAYYASKAGKPIATLAWLWDVSSTGVLTDPKDNLLHFPVPQGKIPGFDRVHLSLSNYTEMVRSYIKDLVRIAGATWSAELSEFNTHVLASCATGVKVDFARSCNIPIVTYEWLEACITSWSFVRLDDYHPPPDPQTVRDLGNVRLATPSLQAWESQARTWVAEHQPPPQPWSKRPRSTRLRKRPDVESPKQSRKRSRYPDSSAGGFLSLAAGGSIASNRHLTRRAASTTTPGISYYATTGLDVTPIQDSTLRKVGWYKMDRVTEATSVLVASALTRTEKMLCAIARGMHIVSPEWLTAQGAHPCLDPDKYTLRDSRGESERKLHLETVLATRRSKHHGILHGHTFYFTSKVKPSASVLRQVVVAAGGSVAHEAVTLQTLLDNPETTHLVSCATDQKVWASWGSLRARNGRRVRVWNAELIIDGVLHQRIHWARNKLLG